MRKHKSRPLCAGIFFALRSRCASPPRSGEPAPSCGQRTKPRLVSPPAPDIFDVRDKFHKPSGFPEPMTKAAPCLVPRLREPPCGVSLRGPRNPSVSSATPDIATQCAGQVPGACTLRLRLRVSLPPFAGEPGLYFFKWPPINRKSTHNLKLKTHN